jgi:hypothetical protein
VKAFVGGEFDPTVSSRLIKFWHNLELIIICLKSVLMVEQILLS